MVAIPQAIILLISDARLQYAIQTKVLYNNCHCKKFHQSLYYLKEADELIRYD